MLGLAGSLTYAWLINPIVYTEASPARLSEQYQREYILLVSQTYAANGDLARARQRLTSLGDEDVAGETAVLLETLIREQQNPETIRQLALLARQLGAESSAIALFAPTPLPEEGAPPTPTTSPTPLPTPTLLSTAAPTSTPLPTSTPTPPPVASPTPPSAYRLLNQQRVCDPAAPRIEVLTWDTLLDPLPGAEVLISWQGGSDRFFTGFKPNATADYGDFTMQPDISYTVTLAEGSTPISGLRLEPCPNGELGGWQLTFQHLTRRSEN